MTKLRRYEAYKDSEIDWLGDIPANWKVRRLKDTIIGSLSYGANESAADANREHPRYIRITDFSEKGNLKEETFRSLPPSVAKSYLLKEGDILFARSGATVGKTFQFKNYIGKACYAGYLIRARPNETTLASDFLSYYTKSLVYESWRNTAVIKATIENISAEKYGFFLYIPIPSIKEQKAIADYLDRKTAQIDRKIELLQQKAAHYAELKQVLINETVTGKRRIIDHGPAATKRFSVGVYEAYQDSGVEWLGNVPGHWEEKRIKDIATLERGKFTHRPRNDPRMYEGKHPFIQTGEVARANKYVTSYKQTLSDEGVKVSKLFDKGTLLMAIAANIGDVAITGFDTYFPDSIVGFKSKINSVDYLYYLLLVTKQELDTVKVTSTQDNLNLERLNSLIKFMPPLQEQQTIAAYLDEKTAQIERVIETIQREIGLLQTLRKTLINDVVTGKIKVVDD